MNGNCYRGCHKTESLRDDYLGSGKLLKAAILKYGKENFARDILEFCISEDAMYELEKVYVDGDFVALKTTYNLRCGGYGGRLTEELRRQAAAKIRCPKTAATRRKMSISRTNKVQHSEATKRKIGLSAKGRLHSEIAREKMSQKARLRVDVGRGTIWISDGISNRRIDPTKTIVPEGWRKGRLIRSRGEMDITVSSEGTV